jgi:hypothetical protein
MIDVQYVEATLIVMIELRMREIISMSLMLNKIDSVKV